ncbi:hypothetical protein [Streptomyces sp. bgisy060]|uniref:hypothetical protein n=1 Tax=Streptomyces sp. bgisy060 TaxID=3413775 RepID=UPI003EB9964D
MSELEELRQRLDALEAEVGRLREESAATRTLSSMTDRDVAEWRVAMRGHTQSLSALRETQLEQGQALNGLNATVRQLSEVVGGIAAGQMQLAEHVAGLDTKVDELEEGQAAVLEYLKVQGEQLQRHGRILERLDPGEPES